MKLERFIFDVLQFGETLKAYYCDRDSEFCPLKNASGAADGTPEHCRDALLALHREYISAAGGRFANDDAIVEISPLVSYDGENLGHIAGSVVFDGVSHIQIGTAAKLSSPCVPAA